LLSDLIAFFRRRRKPGAGKRAESLPKTAMEYSAPGADDGSGYKQNAEDRKRYAERMAALGKRLVPEKRDLDDYLGELGDRWNTLINPDDKQNLFTDVDSVIRDYLRHYIRTLKVRPPSEARLEEMADNLVRNTSFSKIRSQEYLRAYIKVYLYKLIIKSGGF
jgi:hypothetical protein